MNSQLELINASLEQKLNNVQGRVEMLKRDQAKSKDTIKDLHDGLQAFNAIVLDYSSERRGQQSKSAGSCPHAF